MKYAISGGEGSWRAIVEADDIHDAVQKGFDNQIVHAVIKVEPIPDEENQT